MPSMRANFLVKEAPQEGQAEHKVRGAELMISYFGKGQSKLARNQEAKVALKFHGRFLKAPVPTDEAFAPIANIELQGTLAGNPPRPKLRFSESAELSYEAPEKAEDPACRVVELDFSRSCFDQVPPTDHPIHRLHLPPSEDSIDYPHYEVGVSIEVDGGEEASVELNDVLDVPLAPVSVGLVVEWSDELDESVPAGLTLKAKQGEKLRFVRWSDGHKDGEMRQFLFRGIVGAKPIDLFACFNGREVQLWKQQEIPDEEATPEWETLLEDAIFPSASPEPEEVTFRAESVMQPDPQTTAAWEND